MNLTVEAKVENIDPLTNLVNKQLEAMGCSPRVQSQIDIALDELLSNICHYAYGDGTGHVTVGIEEIAEENAVQITIKDYGIPFDPLAHDDPDVSLDIHERNIGGLGIFLVKKTMSDLRYEYRDGCNILTVVKTL